MSCVFENVLLRSLFSLTSFPFQGSLFPLLPLHFLMSFSFLNTYSVPTALSSFSFSFPGAQLSLVGCGNTSAVEHVPKSALGIWFGFKLPPNPLQLSGVDVLGGRTVTLLPVSAPTHPTGM